MLRLLQCFYGTYTNAALFWTNSSQAATLSYLKILLKPVSKCTACTLTGFFTLQLCVDLQLPVDKVIPTCVAKENFLVSESQKHRKIQGQQGIHRTYHGLHIVDCSAYHAVMKVQQSTNKKTRIALKTV